MLALETVRTVTSANRRELDGLPGLMMLAKVEKMGLADSKDFGVSDNRYLPVARMALSATDSYIL